MQKELKLALDILRKGGTILYPSDTIWGMGCDASSSEAVEKIYRIKGREKEKSMLILVSDEFMAERYVTELPDIAFELFALAEKALTLVIPGAKNLAPNIPAPDGSIGMRIPDDPFCQALLRQFRRPIVSSSANFSGRPSPKDYYDIDSALKEQVDHVVNWRQDDTRLHRASSVIKLGLGGEIKILRK